ncbi:hypothetical protein BDR07DRAFT_1059093 [Suillus spraguei]|nr:hypothetical protein BDR07DRAFT_1059093 [Suillus spraguei]
MPQTIRYSTDHSAIGLHPTTHGVRHHDSFFFEYVPFCHEPSSTARGNPASVVAARTASDAQTKQPPADHGQNLPQSRSMPAITVYQLIVNAAHCFKPSRTRDDVLLKKLFRESEAKWHLHRKFWTFP